MNNLMKMAITIVVAVIGGMFFRKLKIPGGAMIGAMVVTVVFSLSTNLAYMPFNSSKILQLFTGIMLGTSISKNDIKSIKKLILPIAILIIGMVFLDLIFGILIYLLCDLDVITALFACAPGGITDMSIIADDMGANASYVVVLQLCRLLLIYLILPPIFKKMSLSDTKKGDNSEKRKSDPERSIPQKKSNIKTTVLFFLLSIVCGVAPGLVFWKLGIMAGALIGSMIGSAVFNITTDKGVFPKVCRPCLGFFAGAIIGQKVTLEIVLNMSQLIVPVLILAFGVLAFTFGIGHIIRRVSKLDAITCLMCSTPGGVQEMSILAEDLGADATKVAVLQTIRLYTVIVLFPSIIKLVTNLIDNFGL